MNGEKCHVGQEAAFQVKVEKLPETIWFPAVKDGQVFGFWHTTYMYEFWKNEINVI